MSTEGRYNQFLIQENMQKLILSNPLSPGDILMSTSAFRDLHLAYPGKYLTDFRVPSGCEQIFDNNPYITKIDDNDPEARHIRLDYSEIHRSGVSGRAFAEAHTMDLAKNLGIEIPITKLSPDIFLSDTEKNWLNPATLEFGDIGDYWVVNCGVKNDYTLKRWYHYQEMVNEAKNRLGVKFVQIGDLRHDHPLLDQVYDLRGRTDLRQLFRLQYHAQGVVCGVSLSMVIQNAFRKPCVVLAGARETLRWQIDDNCQYLYTNGCMDCTDVNSCWKSKKESCLKIVDSEPLCMKLITPTQVVDAMERYYIGGKIK